jgi:hypothetical protein
LICADTSSNDPIELAGLLARDHGTVIAVGAFGLNIPRKIYYEKELTFKVSRSYGPGRYDQRYEEGGVDYPYAMFAGPKAGTCRLLLICSLQANWMFIH